MLNLSQIPFLLPANHLPLHLLILSYTILYCGKSKQSDVVRLLTNKDNDRRDRLPALNSAQLRLEMDNFNFIFYQTFPFSFSLHILPGWS